MPSPEDIDSFLTHMFETEGLLSATLSAPVKRDRRERATLRSILVKGRPAYQLTELRGEQAWHRNFLHEEGLDWLRGHLREFKQVVFHTEQADYHLLSGKRKYWTLIKRAPTRPLQPAAHNREKSYLLREGICLPFLVRLGIMNPSGKVHAEKRNKFRQINRFLEMVDDVLPALEGINPLRIVDFGCGKAYLTFALYYFLTAARRREVELVGIDLKSEVIEHCRDLAAELACSGMHFIQGSIADCSLQGTFDMVVSLHACDTATDHALAKAVGCEARVILAAPCCQHELRRQVKQKALQPLLKHGILKERFAVLATDAARAQLLEAWGYETRVIEFVDLEHSPKNLLIRAVKHPNPSPEKLMAAWQVYLEFKQYLAIKPALEGYFHGFPLKIRQTQRGD